MFEDSNFGFRNKDGHWKPFNIDISPKFLSYIFPFKPFKLFKLYFGWQGVFFPTRFFWILIAAFSWFYLTPSIEKLKSIEYDWVLFILLRNALILLIYYGLHHLHFYTFKRQKDCFKYNPRFLENNNSKFLFKNQIKDNLIWVFLSSVPIWSAYEIVTLWFFANNYFPYVSFQMYPFYCLCVFLLVPIFFDIHFYIVHRILHFKFLYRIAHNVHHKNVNPGPWSGLAMHPLEHILYFSGVIIHFIIPSHPFIAIYHLYHTALAPAGGHSGFDKFLLNKNISISGGDYFHYLHHKYFECNYGSGGTNVLDRLFNTFHDGTENSIKKIKKKRRVS